jgi:hypothetical protein
LRQAAAMPVKVNYPNIDEIPKPSVALTTASIAWN